MARCRPTFNVKTLTVGFRPLPQTTRSRWTTPACSARATAAEVDAALRQRELFGEAEHPVQRVDAAETRGRLSTPVDGSGNFDLR